MRFEQALEAMREGKAVRIGSVWGEASLLLRDSRFVMARPGQRAELRDDLNYVQLLSENWEVVVEPRSLADVLPAFREGKRIRRRSWGDLSVVMSPPEHSRMVGSDDLLADDWEVVD